MTTWNHNKGFIPRTQALFCSKGSFLHAATVVREQGLIHLQITWQQKWSTEFISSKWRSIFHWVPYRCPVARILTRFKVKVSSYQTYHKMNHLPKVNSLIFCNTFASVGGCVPWASKPVPFHGASQAILHKETLPSILAVHWTKGPKAAVLKRHHWFPTQLLDLGAMYLWKSIGGLQFRRMIYPLIFTNNS